ncbi:MAG: hypothetical protein ACPGQR_08985 [Marinirhabdus sp.]
MKLQHRIAYYLGGFAIGLLILFFFLSGKKTSCDYGPGARVLKNINSKERAYSESVTYKLSRHTIDTATISTVLKFGEVVFSESNTRLDPCGQYTIKGSAQKNRYKIRVENCDELLTVLSVAQF